MQKSFYKNLAGFAVLAAGLLVQLMLFDKFCFIERNSRYLSLLYNSIPAIVLSGLCMLGRKKRTGVIIAGIVLLVSDIWLIANCMYFKVNGLFVTWQVAQLAGNLHGYESSMLACLSWKLAAFPLISLLSFGAFAWLRSEKRWSKANVLGAISGLIVVMTLYAASVPLKFKYRRNQNNHFTTEWLSLTTVPNNEGDACSMEYTEHIYMKMHSGLTYLLTFFRDAIVPKAELDLADDAYDRMAELIGEQGEEKQPEGHLLYILVESMEGWIMEATDIHGKPICQNIVRWRDSRKSIYSPNVRSQKIYGESGDGQLICSTGLLPINEGVTCNLYGSNVYPNFAHFYPQSAVISPSTYMFNRSVTTYTYGFKELIEPEKETPWWDDAAVIDSTIAYLSRAKEPSCVMALTVDSHMPFTSHNADVDLPDSLSDMEAHYIRSFRHVDNELGRLLAWADTASCMANATVVLTGDHYILYEGMRGERWCCPLVMSGPGIAEDIRPTRMYQMDIYTTLLDALGQTDYYWQGLGASALKIDMSLPMEEQPGRTHSLMEALYMSNLLIRTNYFAKVQKQVH